MTILGIDPDGGFVKSKLVQGYVEQAESRGIGFVVSS